MGLVNDYVSGTTTPRQNVKVHVAVLDHVDDHDHAHADDQR